MNCVWVLCLSLFATTVLADVDKLKIVLVENHKNSHDDFARYWGVAVVKKNTTFTFEELKGQKSCHTGVDKTVGWKIPVGYLLRKKLMAFVENQYKSVAAFFGASCVPGVSPPILEISSTMDEMVAVPKPPAVNNWLKLTIGLISKDYKERQMIIKARQLFYLQHREAYIDEQMELGSKYPDRPKLCEVARGTKSLCNIIGTENAKREKLKQDLEKKDTISFNTKGRPDSGKKLMFKDIKDKQNMKIADETELDDCLVVRPRNILHSQEQSLGSSKSRHKSAGWAMNNNKSERPNRTTKKRPESAQTPLTTTTTRRNASARTGSHRHTEGRVKQELDETEKDIALTIHLLQERLGIDRKGMV